MSDLIPALVAVLPELTVVEKDARADMGTYAYDYSTLAGLVKITRPVLAAHGLVALTPIEARGDGLSVWVTLLHTSGERLDFGPFPFPQGRDAQATGSMVTYHRRYALLSVLGMASGDDDDGAAAVPAQSHTGGFRTSLVAAVGKLSDDERENLREWVKDMGLPDSVAKMDEDQCNLVLDWLMGGMEPAGGYE